MTFDVFVLFEIRKRVFGNPHTVFKKNTARVR